MKRLTRSLRDNGIEAFILALETINRPTVTYRAEAFCFLFCNSWELLMKAKILNEGGKIFYKKQRGKNRRSISLDECLNRVFTSENDPIKTNIERISELRNNAIHLVIPFIPIGLMGLFQAGVLNFPVKLREWFGINLSDRIPLGMMVLIYDFDPKRHSLEHAKMTRKLPAETIRWLSNFQDNLGRKASSYDNNALKFYIPINYRLAIVKNPRKSDIVLSSGKIGKESLIIEVPRDPDKTHPFRSKEVIQLVNENLSGIAEINTYDIRCIRHVYKVENKPDFYYKSRFHSPQYSKQFVDWIVKQATQNPEFLLRTRVKADLAYKRKKQQ